MSFGRKTTLSAVYLPQSLVRMRPSLSYFVRTGEGRILTNDLSMYTADKVVFRPKLMTPEKLQELYYWAWDTFYANGGQQLKMGELFAKGMLKEVHNGTYRRYNQQRERGFQRRRETP